MLCTRKFDAGKIVRYELRELNEHLAQLAPLFATICAPPPPSHGCPAFGKLDDDRIMSATHVTFAWFGLCACGGWWTGWGWGVRNYVTLALS